jgi:hypothetical protein
MHTNEIVTPPMLHVLSRIPVPGSGALTTRAM